MSPVVDATSDDTRADAVAAAVEAVRAGGLVVIPTDTVYGVGCDAFDADAVSLLLAAKGRGREMPPPVLIGDPATVDGLATDVPPYVRDVVERFWPGPLTVILTAQPSLRWDLGDTAGTVALRMPDDPIALAVLEAIGPMAVTSANQTGQPPATTVLDAATQLGAAVSVYVDGGTRGAQIPSTILDCTGAEPVVLREGAITEADLAAVLPSRGQVSHDDEDLAPASSSGPDDEDLAPESSASPDDLELPPPTEPVQEEPPHE